jgi:ectoine hydroxylase-related dioxygenase (phytanoyl-CoA dioxygenase family)
MINFQDLETKGFFVVPKFFGNNMINLLINDYNSIADKTSLNQNYSVINSKSQIGPYVKPILNSITNNTNIKVNTPLPFSTYFNNHIFEFTWHQDHEPYYIYQDMYNGVQCWIPIIKPNKYEGGLGLIPNDVLESMCPDLFKSQILGRGAKTFQSMPDGTTLMINDDIGNETILPFSLEKIAVYPELEPGDLLVFRQDVIHKSQPSENARVAIAVRAFDKDGVITKKNYLAGSDRKKEMINKNSSGLSYIKLAEQFIKQGKDSILISDIIN